MGTSFFKRIEAFFDELADPASLLKLFDYLPDVYLYVKDVEGRFVKINQTLIDARGLKSETEILGKTDVDLHPKYWALRYREEDQRVMQLRQPLVDQVWLVPDVQGRLESFVSTKIPLFNHGGQCVGIAGVRRPLNPISADPRDEGGIKAAVRVITEKYAEPIEIHVLAAMAGLSHSQFDRRFRALYRMSPSAYLQRVRVHEASRRLSKGDQAASQIALETGFYDQAHMSRTFRKILGVTPTEFRRINGTAVGED
ncbi:MAG: helix-turn-helix domain-containing protein [Planctomycetaceae bacterium]